VSSGHGSSPACVAPSSRTPRTEPAPLGRRGPAKSRRRHAGVTPQLISQSAGPTAAGTYRLAARADGFAAAWNPLQGRYASTYVNPTSWKLQLDGCASTPGRNDNGAPVGITLYTWKLEPVAGQGLPTSIYQGASCTRTVALSKLGAWETCGVFDAMGNDDARWIADTGSILNLKIAAAASAHHWTDVNTTDVFRHHGYCADGDADWFRSWTGSEAVQGDHDGTAHPRGAGHDAIAELVAAQIKADL
jgi:hypothetical protein